ncbi:MAG: DUF3604 domain-containing protein [Planctomycetota bacterium]|nr:MAG: DUF3604 domain-containing protein [Planctomycetota bacterium]REK49245.1 MAG: DUF3604 domain-containing protein [Planctomycetota bacterium]
MRRRHSRHATIGKLLSLLALVGLAASCNSALAHPPDEATSTPEVAEVPSQRLSGGERFSNNPALAVGGDGTVWTTWIRHHRDQGDEVVVQRGDDDPVRLTQQLGQYLRPVIAAVDEQAWCVWTATERDRVSSIWLARFRDGRWSAAERLAPDETRAHQNPEIAVRGDGQLAVVYQVHTGANYDLHAKIGERHVVVHEGPTNDWDPTVVYDSAGTLHIAWSAFDRGDYDILWKRGDAAPRRISHRDMYDLHPWLTASPAGPVWIAWDVAVVPGHANSGETTITGANHGAKTPSNYGSGEKHGVEVRVLDGETVRTPGSPLDEIVPFAKLEPQRGAQDESPTGYSAGHGSLPKVAVGPEGHAWVIYRALRRTQHGGWLPRYGTFYHWDLVARPFDGEKWGAPVRFADSDGYLEEGDVAVSPGGALVIFGGEQRAGSGRRMRQHLAAERDESNHHHDFAGRVGCNGEVYLAKLPSPNRPAPTAAKLPVASALREASSRLRGRGDRYSVDHSGKTYHLWWGDTHRHSNVSRCSVGIEPSPDDLYRYGDDVCNYDFFALSDHGVHLRNTDADDGNYYWWLNLKLADLYHVPGSMSVLYNFEWTMDFPNGHRNVIYPARPTVLLDREMEASRDLVKGWKLLDEAKARAITIAHTSADPGQGTDWSDHDERYQRVMEIFQSARGSYEHEGCPRQFHRTQNKQGFYWKCLERGYHIGVICSSDHGYGVAYACVYAEENSREAIWQAMYDRRCYGSTTYGLVLDVRSDDHWMGEAWQAAEAPQLEINVEGAAPLRSVEIIGRSQVLHAEGSVEEPLRKRRHQIRWSDPDWNQQTGEQWYYVRVIQTDDEIAWSSPVWVTPQREP